MPCLCRFIACLSDPDPILNRSLFVRLTKYYLHIITHVIIYNMKYSNQTTNHLQYITHTYTFRDTHRWHC